MGTIFECFIMTGVEAQMGEISRLAPAFADDQYCFWVKRVHYKP